MQRSDESSPSKVIIGSYLNDRLDTTRSGCVTKNQLNLDTRDAAYLEM